MQFVNNHQPFSHTKLSQEVSSGNLHNTNGILKPSLCGIVLTKLCDKWYSNQVKLCCQPYLDNLGVSSFIINRFWIIYMIIGEDIGLCCWRRCRKGNLQGIRKDKTCCCCNGYQRPNLNPKVTLTLPPFLPLSLSLPFFFSDMNGSFLFSVLQGSVSEYCFHNCKTAPIIVVPGKGILS